MKVKIGDTYYDSKDIPVMVVLEPFDVDNLKEMFQDSPNNNKYMAFMGAHFKTSEDAQSWMADEFKFMSG